jgi:hypothetical protein
MTAVCALYGYQRQAVRRPSTGYVERVDKP